MDDDDDDDYGGSGGGGGGDNDVFDDDDDDDDASCYLYHQNSYHRHNWCHSSHLLLSPHVYSIHVLYWVIIGLVAQSNFKIIWMIKLTTIFLYILWIKWLIINDTFEGYLKYGQQKRTGNIIRITWK